jgi:hypothetical protein
MAVEHPIEERKRAGGATMSNEGKASSGVETERRFNVV